MQTRFSPAQLLEPAMATSEAAIRKCVHCGFCIATCPTYVLLGDELDSPRGRIYLMKDMLETGRAPTPEIVKHVDRCLSCLACMTTCPSGVNYMHLVDHARAYIEDHYRRSLSERALRALLSAVLPYPRRFRAALALARWARPANGLIGKIPLLRSFSAMLALAPRQPAPRPKPQSEQPHVPKGRVALLRGCAEPVLRPTVREATVRLLSRMGYSVVLAPGEGCCGALVHHLGREKDALRAARTNVDVWTDQIEREGIDAIVITTSGCGTTIKDYGFLLKDDPDYRDRAARVSSLAKDISEFVSEAGLPPGQAAPLRVAYHAACSLQHGQKIVEAPKQLLARAGFTVRTPAEAHLCCGSAGTYNILQPEIAGQLASRKAANLERLGSDVIAVGNIGCAIQIGQKTTTPIVHIAELLDWATGGPQPAALPSTQLSESRTQVGRSAALSSGDTRHD